MDSRPAGLPRSAVDAGLIVVFAVVLVGTAVAIVDSWGGGYWIFGCAAGLVLGVLALMRHRSWAAGVGLAIAGVAVVVAQLAQLPAEPSPATALGLAVLISAAIRTHPIPWAAALGAGGLALVAGTWLTSAAAAVMVSVSLLAALATGLGLRLLDTGRLAAAAQVRRDERLELARELHDIVANHLTGVVLHAQAARVVRRKHPDKLDDSLTGIEAASSDALAAMRRVVGLLRDTTDAAPRGQEQLSELVARFAGHGPTVHLQLPDDEPDWPPEVTSTVYRVVQESLTNITKHAPQAHSVTISVTHDQPAITVEVSDDAPAHPARYSRRGGYGLVGMRERVEALGGTLSAGPAPGIGWSVRAVLPLPARERR